MCVGVGMEGHRDLTLKSLDVCFRFHPNLIALVDEYYGTIACHVHEFTRIFIIFSNAPNPMDFD